jgi:histidine triad (HIT) family protein
VNVEPGCEFCEIIAHDEPASVVLRTDEVIAFFPIEPATLGHTLVVPTKHLPDIWGLDESTAERLSLVTLKVARAVRSALNPDGLNIIQSNGAAATQTVQHLHVHVVPRWADDEMGRIWPVKTNWPEDRKDATLRLVRKTLSELL